MLWDRYSLRRQAVSENLRNQSWTEEGPLAPKTTESCSGLEQHCLKLASNEAFLLHGSNPTAAMSILGTSFSLELAGKSSGTMFGPGIYMAESSTKADEYACDDTDG